MEVVLSVKPKLMVAIQKIYIAVTVIAPLTFILPYTELVKQEI
jgi:hypothetical protein